MRVLDSHLHLWDPELLRYPWLEGPLNSPFAETELEATRVKGVAEEQCVFIQADSVPEQYLDEVRWVSSLAERLGIRAIVAGVQLDREGQSEADLDALRENSLVVGVRHLLQGEPDGFATTPRFLDGARHVADRDLTFDACVQSIPQLQDVVDLADAIPELRIALDHLGKPVVGTAAAPEAPDPAWRTALTALAAHPHVVCKLSGLPAEAGGDWSAEQLTPFLDAAAEAFGPDRLMWGSDWPVSAIGPAEPGETYAPADGSPTYQDAARTRWATTVADWAASRGYDADAILWRNAERFYRRSVPV